MEFQKWPKMPRLEKSGVFVTEKIDGTNAQIGIFSEENLNPQEFDGLLPIVRAGSRTRWLQWPDRDNFGWAKTVDDYKEPLLRLLPGPGRYCGEWAGPGIQKNPLKLPERRFFAFNTGLFTDEYVATIQKEVPWFDVVPVWLRTTLADESLALELLQFRNRVQEGTRPPGVREFDGPPEGFVMWVNGGLVKWTPKGEKWKGLTDEEAAQENRL